jgi:hypothetical protein
VFRGRVASKFGLDERGGSSNNELSMAIVQWYCQHVQRQTNERDTRDNMSEDTHLN